MKRKLVLGLVLIICMVLLFSVITVGAHSNNNPIAGDVDGDGEVTILDATAIQLWLADEDIGTNIGEPIISGEDNVSIEASELKGTDDLFGQVFNEER